MNKLLTLKHWQLFLLMIGLPMILEFSLTGYAISSRNLRAIFAGFPIIMIIFLVPFLSWFYSLGTNLFKRLPVTVKMNLTKFKIFLFVYAAYILFLLTFIGCISINASSDGRLNPGIFFFIFPL